MLNEGKNHSVFNPVISSCNIWFQCYVDHSEETRMKVYKLAESCISGGVQELGAVAKVGANERAFHIVEVMSKAVQLLVWAVQEESGMWRREEGKDSFIKCVFCITQEIESAFQRLSSLLSVETTKLNVLVTPLRAVILQVFIPWSPSSRSFLGILILLQGIASLAEKSHSLVG